MESITKRMAAYEGVVPDEENIYLSNPHQPEASATMQNGRLQTQEKKQSSIRKILGFEELISLKIWRASLAELMGTAILAFALDTIAISTSQTQTTIPLLIISILTAFIISTLVIATFPISGGFINPTVTFAAALTGLISLSKAFIYISAQCIGGIIGALALKAVINTDTARTYALGGCTIRVYASRPEGPAATMGIATGRALWMETICGFIFLFAAIRSAFDDRQAKAFGRVTVVVTIGAVLGLLGYVSALVTDAKGYGGAGLNPAKCFGSAVVRGGELWDGHWVFWVGPFIACVVFALYTRIISKVLV
ncbi:uncharacterized protein LOC126682461 [Mercurialis annua]|uniref:uncharacterized protein LOC126682461 n=1 Tax=Mercurialis annua TaxID=3986 RepID=UPI00215DFE1F|nr:uncharacterized protein LOC126682461 [Mercurialis annua]